jgi:hypothetical protein
VPSNVIAGFVQGNAIDLLGLHETVAGYGDTTLSQVGGQASN